MSSIEGKEARRFAAYAKKSGELFTKVIKLSDVGPSDEVAVLADGSGEFTDLLKGWVRRTVSVEMSEEMVEMLRDRFGASGTVGVVKGDIRKVGLKSGRFDKVFLVRALHHVKEKDEVAEEAFRLLKEGGKFLIVDTFFEGDWLDRILFPIKWELLHRRKLKWDEPCPLFPTERELEETLKEAGFGEVEVEELGEGPESGTKTRGRRFLASARKPSG